MGILNYIKDTLRLNREFYENEAMEDYNRLPPEEKALVLTGRITAQDMRQIANLPYLFKGPVHISSAPNSRPYAYMDLGKEDQATARRELEIINEVIAHTRRAIPSLPAYVSIKTDKVIFTQEDPYHGYTRFICTPCTPTGKPAKYPLQLSFSTRLDQEETYTAHGDLHYGRNGHILKAEVYLWYRVIPYATPDGWFFYFSTINGNLILKEVKSTDNPDKNGMAGTIYKAEGKTR